MGNFPSDISVIHVCRKIGLLKAISKISLLVLLTNHQTLHFFIFQLLCVGNILVF